MMKNDKPAEHTAKKLSVLDGWAIGSGAMIGVTIFVVSGLMSGIAGPAASLSFIFAAGITVIIALCYCEVSAAFPRSGGAYIYPKETIGGPVGRFLSFISGFAFYGGQGLGPAALALTLAYYVNWSLKLMGLGLPVSSEAFAILCILFFGIVNMVDTRLGNFLQLISTFLVIGALVIYVGWGSFHIDPGLYKPFMPFGLSGVITAAAVGWAAFSGWSSIPNMASEFENPSRDVPRSMLLSLITCGIAFSVIALVMNGLLPYQELALHDAPVAESFKTFTQYGGLIIALGGIFAAVSTMNGLMMTGSRILYSMGLEGSLPSGLAKVNERNGTPWVAVTITMAGMVILAWTGLVSIIMQMVVFVTVCSWIITCVCLMALRTKRKDIVSPFRVPFYPVTPILAIGISLFMMMRLAPMAILIGVAWMALGAVLYFVFSKTPLRRYCAGLEQETTEAYLPESAPVSEGGNI
jgi:amino acid transporter